MFIPSLLAKPKILVAVGVLAAGIFSGCNFWDPISPQDHIGDNGLAWVETSATPGEVDVSLHNAESKWVVGIGTGCNWDASCMVTQAEKHTTQPGFLQAIADCEVWVGGQVCGQWIYRAAEYFAWAGGGPNQNCIGFRIDFAGNYIGGNGLLSIPGTWEVSWPGDWVGYNADGWAVCTD